MKIKAIIVDDDFKSRKLIKDYCEEYFSNKIEILDDCESVDNAIFSIEKNKPDLVFLDIDMPEKNGFDLINHYSKIVFEIVFVTGHSNQFIKAIDCGALNYLMKPINPLNIKSIIENFENRDSAENSKNRIAILKENMEKGTKSIAFPDNDGFKIVIISEILYCETGNGDGKCKITTPNDNIVASKALNKMSELLPNDIFLKVSGSAIINKNFVKSFNSKKSVLIMKNDYQIKVSDKFYNKTNLMNAIAN
ncbi:LytR/AlgR family response regulator transcription factor [Flavobacterium sp. P21]|uniref:LytR/AlgR family response regulator transcription factor n=1 Tax=Flavobacterium sp. P21 TaxID=3423948 RepID=UPI003D664655